MIITIFFRSFSTYTIDIYCVKSDLNNFVIIIALL